MKIALFTLIIGLTIVSAAKELNTSLPFEGTHTQSDHTEGRKTVRDGDNSGKCGANISWFFNSETSTLTISGQGNMSCCNHTFTPWSEFSKQVQNIEI